MPPAPPGTTQTTSWILMESSPESSGVLYPSGVQWPLSGALWPRSAGLPKLRIGVVHPLGGAGILSPSGEGGMMSSGTPGILMRFASLL
jgi:hypothetical protein